MEDCKNATPATPFDSKKAMGSRQRASGVELFRIISMLFIVAHHYVVNSGLISAGGPIYEHLLSKRSLFLLLFGAWGKTGINCFVLITGYFMCKSQITLKKFAKLVLEVEFYKIIIYFIFLFTGKSAFAWDGFIKALLPISDVSTDFPSCYMLFFLTIPFLNILVRNMTQKQHTYLLLLLGFAYVFLGTLPRVPKIFPSIPMKFNYITWFIVLYFISSYIRLYPKKIYSNTKFWGIAALSLFLLSALSVIFCAWTVEKHHLLTVFYFVSDSNKLLAVLTGISSFLFFLNLNLGHNRFINAVASTTFGVLLIHANSDMMRQWLWRDTLHNVEMYSSQLLVVHAAASVIGVFVICAVIDYLRICFLEKPVFQYWDKHIEQITRRFSAGRK